MHRKWKNPDGSVITGDQASAIVESLRNQNTTAWLSGAKVNHAGHSYLIGGGIELYPTADADDYVQLTLNSDSTQWILGKERGDCSGVDNLLKGAGLVPA